MYSDGIKVQAFGSTVSGNNLTLPGTLTAGAEIETASNPVLNLSQTWNNAGVAFTGAKLNVTDTASSAGSLLLDLQVGAATKFNVTKQGDIANVRDISVGRYINMASYGDTYLSRGGVATLQLGVADGASPTAQTLGVQNVVAGTTNTAGANFTIAGSRGTGTGAGGSILFQVAPAGTTGSTQNALATALTIASDKSTTLAGNLTIQATGGLFMTGANPAVTFGASGDVVLVRDAANYTLALKNATNAMALNVYNTYTDTSNYERAGLSWIATSNRFFVGTTNAGTGTLRWLDLQGAGIQIHTSAGTSWDFNSTGHFIADVDNTFDIGQSGANRPRNLYVAGNGNFNAEMYANSGFKTQASGYFIFNSRGQWTAPADGRVLMTNAAGTDFSRFMFGGTTSSFPAIKRNGAGLAFRKADDSADADISAAAATLFTATITSGAINGSTTLDLRSAGSYALTLGTGAAAQWSVNTAGNFVGASGYAIVTSGNGSYVRTGGQTVANLPAAATAGAGARAFVTDATSGSCVFGTTIVGGSSTNCPVYSDGTNWKAGG